MLRTVASRNDDQANNWSKGKKIFQANEWRKILKETTDTSRGATKAALEALAKVATNGGKLTLDDVAFGECIQWSLTVVRQAVVSDMLNELKTQHNNGATFGSEGSGDATSDIDLNLNGAGNEALVVLFNKAYLLKNGVESGALIDVNVYAEDYLTASLKADAHKSALVDPTDGGTRKLCAEGSACPFLGKLADNFDKKAALLNWSPQATAPFVSEENYANMETMALFKIAQYMSKTEFAEFSKRVIARFKHIGNTSAKVKESVAALEKRFAVAVAALHQHDVNMKAAIERIIPGKCKLSEEQAKVTDPKTYVETVEHVCYASWIQAANELYGKKITANSKFTGERASTEFLGHIAAAVSYSNEPMVSQGAVIHVVGILQMNRPWALPPSYTVQTFLENFGDFIKEAIHNAKNHKTDIFALINASKYGSRLGESWQRIKKLPNFDSVKFSCEAGGKESVPAEAFSKISEKFVYNVSDKVPSPGPCLENMFTKTYEPLFMMKKKKIPLDITAATTVASKIFGADFEKAMADLTKDVAEAAAEAFSTMAETKPLAMPTEESVFTSWPRL